MKTVELVFIPSPSIGHLVPMVETAKLLVERDDRLSITILVMKLSFDTSIDAYTKSLASINKRIRLIDLPQEEPNSSSTPVDFMTSYVENKKLHVKDVVNKLTQTDHQSGSNSPRLAGFVIDIMCTTMIDVANEFGIPTYLFIATSAAFLGSMFHLQELHDVADFKDSNTEFVIPSFVNPVPVNVLSSVVLDKNQSHVFHSISRRFRETKASIVRGVLMLWNTRNL
uniref:Uncharacterized protein n=1 Tax=Fagus sylvatica TaxID=28930 RepID=A0A2N9GCM4_FAGSY